MTAGPNGAAVLLNNLLTHRQPQSAALAHLAAGRIRAVHGVKDLAQLILIHADAVVCKFQDHHPIIGGGRQCQPTGHTRASVLNRIAQNDQKYPAKSVRVDLNLRICRAVIFQRKAVIF